MPQPPPSSTPAVISSPGASSTPSRSSLGSRPKLPVKHDSNSVNGRPPSRPIEPATDDDSGDDGVLNNKTDMHSYNGPDETALSHGTIDTMERQTQQIMANLNKQHHKHQLRFTRMCETMTGKEEQLTRLHGSYEALSQQLTALESLCDIEMDAETLDKLFNSIPHHDQILENGVDTN